MLEGPFDNEDFEWKKLGEKSIQAHSELSQVVIEAIRQKEHINTLPFHLALENLLKCIREENEVSTQSLA